MLRGMILQVPSGRMVASQVELPQLREELRHRGVLRRGGSVARLRRAQPKVGDVSN